MKLLPQGKREWMIVLLRWATVIAGVGLFVMFTVCMPGRSHKGPLRPLSEKETAVRDNLRRHVKMLAGTIGARNVLCMEKLVAAQVYIRQSLADAGYEVTEQKYTVGGKEVNNLIVETGPAASPGGIVVVGAHYDTAGETPGANDNGSGVAALIELARMVKVTPPPAGRIRFVAFVNEEPPFFTTPSMGSYVYAKELHNRGERIAGMFSLETIGYYSDAPKSQHYPAGFGLFYPDTGNFIGFVGNLSSHSLVCRAVRTFREYTSFPSEGVATFGWLPGIFWSDHWAFWKHGYPAVMVTDTAPYRYPYYHDIRDTPEKLDYDRMARVVSGLFCVIRDAACAK